MRHPFRLTAASTPWRDTRPIREELFSVERLETHARSLAVAQAHSTRAAAGRSLAGRLTDNEAVLLAAYRHTVVAVEAGTAITPAAEWLVDNYHLVEKHIRNIQVDLPPGYYRQLPKLAAGPLAGYPVVLGIAWAFVAHADSRFDAEMLRRFVRAYQEVQPLTIGELWALSVTLRIVLIENLRRLADQTISSRMAREHANLLADRLLGTADHPAIPVRAAVAGLTDGPLAEAFAVQLAHRLRDQDQSVVPALTWLERRLVAQGTSAEIVVANEHRRQGASNVSVRNIITSLRMISDVDWEALFEQMSLVDDRLAAAGAFRQMDFATRNLYRSAIEDLARHAGRSETDVAALAVARAERPAPEGDDGRWADPGTHLIGTARLAFEKELGYRPPWRSWPMRLNTALGVGPYLGGVALATGLVLVLPMALLAAFGAAPSTLVVLATCGFLPAMDAAIALVNRAVTCGFRAAALPGLSLRDGVPAELRTIVAVPMLLTGEAAIAEQIERLEVHHLASPEGDLHFALLSDWTDAETAETPGDQALLAAVTAGIARLNAHYGPAPGGARFLLLHRPRRWGPTEARWMGWERKRGKLHALNRALRGATDSGFLDISALPADVRFVVTLDADTRLPRDTIRRLIGKMAHPLNRARVDVASGRVVAGHGVLQPRVTPSLPMGRDGSHYQRIFSSPGGIDPYAAAVSDVYQDLFSEGSYAGKGIYDVDAFEASLAGRVPDGAMLSHDLFEGIFARAALASDVEVVEEFPSRYDVGALRHHRWARGDWQLLPWIVGDGPATGDASAVHRDIPAVGRWKMLDNLRRTLTAPAAVVALAAGWALPLAPALVWAGFVLATMLLPALIPVLAAAVPRRPDVTVVSHLRALAADLRMALAQVALGIAFLADQAWLMGDAVCRTLWRLYVSRRHLLEWVTAAQATGGNRLTLSGFAGRMAGGVGLGLAGLALAGLAGKGAWPAAAGFAALWAAAPVLAWWISQSHPGGVRAPLPQADVQVLRQTARRTWRFFECFVTAADHMLPPDNFQEDPSPVLAHRTSPTNMGLYLLSIVAARDFGWIGSAEMVERLEATLAEMANLERFRGHFYNWYDTSDLRPLDPRYVSSVDSGNLAGHLITLSNAAHDWRITPPAAPDRAGILDAIGLARGEAVRLADRHTAALLDTGLADLAAATRKLPAGRGGLDGIALQAEATQRAARALAEQHPGSCDDLLFWTTAILRTIASQHNDQTPRLAERLSAIEDAAAAMAMGMEFGFLLEPTRKLLSIGFLVAEGTLDPSCYDLLASEARLASFVAIAKGDVPARHWFRLGRAATRVGTGAALISWSGSMFEYLMPALVMRAPAGSLLEHTSRLIVQRQIDYAVERRQPWGISESAYNARDLEFTYQYSNFGIPDLGLKRGLGENMVVAPYATALATMVDPHAAVANLARLSASGARGTYGFYEALDYTPARVPLGAEFAVVRAFMAHHQGMTIVAIANAVLGGVMRVRFHGEPMVQATELLLQERVPRDIATTHSWAAEVKSTATERDLQPAAGRRFTTAHQASPASLLLSNGRFTTMLTTAGSGYSRWGDLAITRWREDATCDDAGSYILLRDVQSGAVWSAGQQPAGIDPDSCHITFEENRAEFIRADASMITGMEVIISGEDDAEVRRISLTNSGRSARTVDVTSYAELVLAPQSADVAHPAFSKLFVETAYVAEIGALLATRRRRAPGEPEVWAAHFCSIDDPAAGGVAAPQVETDRARFLGRGNSLRHAAAMRGEVALSGTVGTVLDPIFALRRRVTVPAGATVRLTFWTMVADTRDGVLASVDRHADPTAFTRAATLAWTQAQVQLYHLAITATEAGLFQRLAGHVIHATARLRPPSPRIAAAAGPQSGLWGQGISGDLPLVLLRIDDIEHLEVVRSLLKAHEYWGMKQLAVDLVILNDRQASYVQDLQIAIETLLRTSRSRRAVGPAARPGRVYALRVDLIPPETGALLAAAARVVLLARRGSLADQMDRLADSLPDLPRPAPSRRLAGPPAAPEPALALEFFNGLGGFDKDGSEYVTRLGPGQTTPAPWINVIANPGFGFQVSAEGGGYTWAVNSRENQLTPWSNDPVTDRSGEAFYLRDADSGAMWSPTAQLIRDPAAIYTARHGRGFSRFGTSLHGIESDLLQFVPLDAPLKISRLILRNRTAHTRRISVAAYVEWVLGPSRQASLPFVVTRMDDETGAMFAQNPWSLDFGANTAFLDLRHAQTDATGDRTAFLGRHGSLAAPAALVAGGPLTGGVGAGLDPCGALRTTLVLPPGGEAEVVCLLGQAADADGARALVAHWRGADLDAALAAVAVYWAGVLGQVQVRTPDRALDIMLNGWLLYQTIACRVWARAAFYQAGGAYGFRDQLQDGMSLATVAPAMTRAQLLRAAARQFPEGDVQHWWLPHSGQGVRTRISDDRAWLAVTTIHYVRTSGDAGVLDEAVPFLEGPLLVAGEHDSFFRPTVSDHVASLYEHCALAIEASLGLGAHGLPLIGTGDWNDGMNRVGEQGRGESVWLGWLHCTALDAFVPLAEARGEPVRAAAWRAHAAALRAALERDGWDGAWYRRGFYDDGTPLGAAAGTECRIDAIAQSWAVLSGGGEPARAVQAMESVVRELVRPADGIALLFTPPFDTGAQDPGYIKGYPPGIRENGGQYTHAALWSVMALAALGQGTAAGGLLALLNPINHARNPAEVQRYKVEPYVIAADVYSTAPHVGRGGWTWYTGSGAWMQRAGIETVLGLRQQGGELVIDPCIPAAWPGFEATFRHGGTALRIEVENPDGVQRGIVSASLDGQPIAGRPLAIPLVDDGATHRLLVRLG